jgi:hypothetical protein
VSVIKDGLVETATPLFVSVIKEHTSDLCALMVYAMDRIYAIVKLDGKVNNAIWASVKIVSMDFALGLSSVNVSMGGLVKTAQLGSVIRHV